MTSWKTTLLGLVSATAGFVAYSPDMFGGEGEPLVQVCKFINLGGLAGLGLVAKDWNVTGRKGSGG